MQKDDIYFILYKPAVPGNIGSSARALKTMGFSRLVLIDPADHLSDEAKMLAHGSHDILENAAVFSNFEEARKELDFLICTTAKNRSAKVDYIESRDISAFLDKKENVIQKAGIVFGTEESGLPNSIIQACNVAVSVPMETIHPSLNLSQAVMILAYELSRLSFNDHICCEVQSEVTWKILQERATKILSNAGIEPGTPLFHRIMERMSMMSAADARLVHSISSRLEDILG